MTPVARARKEVLIGERPLVAVRPGALPGNLNNNGYQNPLSSESLARFSPQEGVEEGD